MASESIENNMRQQCLVRQNYMWEQPLDGRFISDAGHQRKTSLARGQRRRLLLLQELPSYPACWRLHKPDFARPQQGHEGFVHVDVQHNMILRRALGFQKIDPLPAACCLDNGTQKLPNNTQIWAVFCAHILVSVPVFTVQRGSIWKPISWLEMEPLAHLDLNKKK